MVTFKQSNDTFVIFTMKCQCCNRPYISKENNQASTYYWILNLTYLAKELRLLVIID